MQVKLLMLHLWEWISKKNQKNKNKQANNNNNKKTNDSSCWQGENLSLLVWMQTSTATMKISMKFPKKTENQANMRCIVVTLHNGLLLILKEKKLYAICIKLGKIAKTINLPDWCNKDHPPNKHGIISFIFLDSHMHIYFWKSKFC